MNGINFRRRMLMGAAHYNASFDFNNYLTIEALEDNLTVTFTNDIEYTIDGNEWITLKAKNKTQPINIGQTLSFRGELTPNSSTGIGTFTINKKCNLKGNCMSMLFGDNAANNYSLSGKNYAFYKLFYNCKNIVNVDSNFLPATTLADYCYNKMFMGCSSLTTAPELPATTLTQESYYCMFSDCTSLVNAPKLSAINLAAYSMCNMFNGCTSLELVDMTGSIGVPTLSNVNNFSNTNDTYKIVVPDSLYDTWIVTTNWASIASHIMKKSDWNAAHPDDILG